MPPKGLKNRAGDSKKSMKNRTFNFRGCPGGLRVPPWLQKWPKFDFWTYLKTMSGQTCNPAFEWNWTNILGDTWTS